MADMPRDFPPEYSVKRKSINAGDWIIMIFIPFFALAVAAGGIGGSSTVQADSATEKSLAIGEDAEVHPDEPEGVACIEGSSCEGSDV